MYVLLGAELVEISYDSKQVERMLGLFFDGWPWKFASLPSSRHVASSEISVRLDLRLFETIDLHRVTLSSRPVFSDQRSQTSIFEDESGWRICFGNHAVAHIPRASKGTEDVVIKVQLTSDAIGSGRLEDIIFTSLAPVLRHRGIFLVHAFAVAKNDGAVLLVGASGSGKTTTGLNLTLRGWSYLANDVVLIKEDDGLICAWPTPGGIGIDTRSYPFLRNLPGKQQENSEHHGKRYLPAKNFVAGWAVSPAPIVRILFPVLEESCEIDLVPLPDAVTAARLMEESIDRWDPTNLETHMRILNVLSRQVKGFDLRLNRDLEKLPAILDEA